MGRSKAIAAVARETVVRRYTVDLGKYFLHKFWQAGLVPMVRH
jgi:hypothetical protein